MTVQIPRLSSLTKNNLPSVVNTKFAQENAIVARDALSIQGLRSRRPQNDPQACQNTDSMDDLPQKDDALRLTSSEGNNILTQLSGAIANVSPYALGLAFMQQVQAAGALSLSDVTKLFADPKAMLQSLLSGSVDVMRSPISAIWGTKTTTLSTIKFTLPTTTTSSTVAPIVTAITDLIHNATSSTVERLTSLATTPNFELTTALRNVTMAISTASEQFSQSSTADHLMSTLSTYVQEVSTAASTLQSTVTSLLPQVSAETLTSAMVPLTSTITGTVQSGGFPLWSLSFLGLFLPTLIHALPEPRAGARYVRALGEPVDELPLHSMIAARILESNPYNAVHKTSATLDWVRGLYNLARGRSWYGESFRSEIYVREALRPFSDPKNSGLSDAGGLKEGKKSTQNTNGARRDGLEMKTLSGAVDRSKTTLTGNGGTSSPVGARKVCETTTRKQRVRVPQTNRTLKGTGKNNNKMPQIHNTDTVHMECETGMQRVRYTVPHATRVNRTPKSMGGNNAAVLQTTSAQSDCGYSF